MGTILSVKCRALGVMLKRSLITHLQAGTGIFAATQFEKGDVVEYYYGFLVYKVMTRGPYMTETYGEASKQVMRKTFRK